MSGGTMKKIFAALLCTQSALIAATLTSTRHMLERTYVHLLKDIRQTQEKFAAFSPMQREQRYMQLYTRASNFICQMHAYAKETGGAIPWNWVHEVAQEVGFEIGPCDQKGEGYEE